MYLNKEIDDETYDQELTYFKYHEATEWIIEHQSKSSFMNNQYPKRRKINDLKIDLWFGVNMFNYCKKDHTFSIFYNTKTIIAPYIPDHYILCYSTLNETPTFKYSYE